MELNNEQYRRVARYLDGESGQLSDEELAAAEEVRRIERMLAPMLEVSPPARAIDGAARRMMIALARRQGLMARFARPLAAAAAILLLATAVYLIPSRPMRRQAASGLPADLMAEVYAQTEQNVDLDLIKTELDDLTADIMVSLPIGALEAEFDALQQNLDTFWLEESEQWPDEI